MEAGFLSVEIEELNLALTSALGEEFKIRIDVEIKGGFNIFQWASTGDSKYSTSTFVPVLRETVSDVNDTSAEQDNGESERETFIYVHGFNNMFVRSTYIDLDAEVFGGIANTSLEITVVSVNSNQPAPVASKKGQPPPLQEPAEKPLYSLSISLAKVLMENNCSVALYDTFALQLAKSDDLRVVKVDESVVSQQSTLIMKVNGDNDMAEFVLGSRVISWSRAILGLPPVRWTLQCPDPVDPKAKKQPTAEDLRAKYLENISNMLASLDTYVSYSMEIGEQKQLSETVDATATATATAAADGEAAAGDDEPKIDKFLPGLKLPSGQLEFNFEAAAGFKPADDIRSMGDLWKVCWGRSELIFLHRSKVRELVKFIRTNPYAAELPLVMRRTPTAAHMESQGGELTCRGTIDLKQIVEPGRAVIDMPIALDWVDDAAVTSETSLVVTYSSVAAGLVPAKALDSLTAAQKDAVTNSYIPDGLLSNKLPSSNDPNTTILTDLRREITSCVERIAQEYLSLYPVPPGDGAGVAEGALPMGNGGGNGAMEITTTTASVASRSGGGGGGADSESQGSQPAERKEDRLSDFLDFLTKSGIFHELKESLKPRVQLLIREQYGIRGRALGRSEALAAIDMQSTTGVADGKQLNASSVESIMSELYVYLLKECSIVLNSLFKETVVDRDVAEFEKNAYVNDEEETEAQAVARLLNQADDATANGAYAIADSLHLERIQIINHSPVLGSKPDIVHAAYASYGVFLLQQCASMLTASVANAPADMEQRARSLRDKARAALKATYNAKSDDWSIGLLYANILIDSDQVAQAEVVLRDVIGAQVAAAKPSPFAFDLDGFDAFDGYDSDKLCPADSSCYAVLAALFYTQGFPLKARKAILMANRSFVEGEENPPLSTHGSPRRTVVLILARTSTMLFRHSFFRMGHACLRLALDSEEAVTAKAKARGKPATTVPHIRCLLKEAQALGAMSSTDAVAADAAAAQQHGGDMQLVAAAPLDMVRAWVVLANTQQFAGADQAVVIDSYLKAIEASHSMPLVVVEKAKAVPLAAFIKAGKLLIMAGRFAETVTMLLYACSVYTSATLLMLLGVACLRLDELDDAEAALVEANMLDNRNADVWAYLSLVCVSSGPHRLFEAEKSLQQSLRLGQSNSSLLRELATSFMSVDKLQTAEDLIRRALAVEAPIDEASAAAAAAAAGSGKRANAHTRKLLADVLAGQNQAAKAVDEYQAVLSDESLDAKVKLEVAQKCSGLLKTLGREEELAVLREIIYSLESAAAAAGGSSSVTSSSQPQMM